MFGDVTFNNKNWESKPLKELCEISRGASPRPILKYLGGTVPWIKIGDATLGDNIYINRTKEHILSTKMHFFLSLGRKLVPNQHSYASIRIKSTHMMTKTLCTKLQFATRYVIIEVDMKSFTCLYK